MAEGTRQYVDDVPQEMTEKLRECCLRLPDAYEEKAWVGNRWMVVSSGRPTALDDC